MVAKVKNARRKLAVGNGSPIGSHNRLVRIALLSILIVGVVTQDHHSDTEAQLPRTHVHKSDVNTEI